MSTCINANWGGDHGCSFDDNDIHELASGFPGWHRCTKCHQLLCFGIRERTRKQGFLWTCEDWLPACGDTRREVREAKRDDGQHSAHNCERAMNLRQAQTCSPHGNRFVVTADTVRRERTSEGTRDGHRQRNHLG